MLDPYTGIEKDIPTPEELRRKHLNRKINFRFIGIIVLLVVIFLGFLYSLMPTLF